MTGLTTIEPGLLWSGVGVTAFGLLALARGIQLTRAKIPYFVEDYRGWSCPTLTLPYGGAFLTCIGVGILHEIYPVWFLETISLVWFFSGTTTLLGMFVWFPWFLLPGWYRRARKAGVPRHDPHAMARFKRLTKAQQRTTTWPNLPDTP